MVLPVLTQPPPTDREIRDRVVDALRLMLIAAEDDPLESSVPDGGGLTVKLAHDYVRCLLIFDLLETTPTLSPRAIATTLDISSWTVSTHLRRVFAKLGVSNRAEMVNQLFAAPQPPDR